MGRITMTIMDDDDDGDNDGDNDDDNDDDDDDFFSPSNLKFRNMRL